MSERIIKPWGWSQEVYRDELTRVVRIHVEPGGFCSWHKHERQLNSFIAVRGRLVIEKKLVADGKVGINYANAGWNAVNAGHGLIHRFVNQTNEVVEALEIYTSIDGTPPDENDIVRFSEGGIAKQAE